MKNPIILVRRDKENVIVSIMRNKSDNTYSFVNFTKGHICSCRFKTIEEAMCDLRNKMESKEVTGYDVF